MSANAIIYFGDGSNMLTARLQARTPSARFHSLAHLPGHRLRFHKVSDDQSGKGDMEYTGDAEHDVEGVLFTIDRGEKAALDQAEGLGHGYIENGINVVTLNGVVKAVAYVATDKNPVLRPYHWYKALVLAGAIEHGLEPHYVDALWAVESWRDPMPRRRNKLAAEALLERTPVMVDEEKDCVVLRPKRI